MSELVERIVEFYRRYSGFTDERYSDENIRKMYLLHEKYGTSLVVYDDKKDIIAVCRWNVKGDTGHILDIVIKPGERGLIRKLLTAGLNSHPYVNKLIWEREYKYPDRKQTIFFVRKKKEE